MGLSAVTQHGGKRSKHGVIAVACLRAHKRPFIKKVAQPASMLGQSHLEQHVVVLGDTLLGPKLKSKEMTVGEFKMPHRACKACGMNNGRKVLTVDEK